VLARVEGRVAARKRCGEGGILRRRENGLSRTKCARARQVFARAAVRARQRPRRRRARAVRRPACPHLGAHSGHPAAKPCVAAAHAPMPPPAAKSHLPPPP
jgi:hypothetical protein